jgi:hypothetical protein
MLKLNITMSVIVVSYLTRAVLVLALFGPMPLQYRSVLTVNYFEWLIGTRWLPYILCSFFLISSMSQSGVQLSRHAAEREALLLTRGSLGHSSGSSQSFASKRSSNEAPPLRHQTSVSYSQSLLSWLLRTELAEDRLLHQQLLEDVKTAASTDSGE